MHRNTVISAANLSSPLLSAYTWDAWHQGPLSSDLSHLVAEIHALRGQLEQSIEVNNGLRLQLEQQLDRGASKASLSTPSVSQNSIANSDPGSKQPLFQGRKERASGSPQQAGRPPGCLWGRDNLASSKLLKVRVKLEMLQYRA